MEQSKTFVSFKPAKCRNWILQVSQSKTGMCIIMHHLYTRDTRVAFAKTKEEASMFVSMVIEKEEM
jgi:hypothetical protein